MPVGLAARRVTAALVEMVVPRLPLVLVPLLMAEPVEMVAMAVPAAGMAELEGMVAMGSSTVLVRSEMVVWVALVDWLDRVALPE